MADITPITGSLPQLPGLPVPSVGQLIQKSLPGMLPSSLVNQITQLLYVKTHIGGYFFDAIFRTEHTSQLAITSHPVQGGANISDHCYLQPARVVMDVGASDCNASVVLGQFLTASSKSKSAFDALFDTQKQRMPIDLHTRLKDYKNMLIENIVVNDDLKTSSAVRATVTLRQVITVDVAPVTVSARAHATNTTSGGVPQPVVPNRTIARQIGIATGIEKP